MRYYVNNWQWQLTLRVRTVKIKLGDVGLSGLGCQWNCDALSAAVCSDVSRLERERDSNESRSKTSTSSRSNEYR
jgi:hypothetical protein